MVGGRKGNRLSRISTRDFSQESNFARSQKQECRIGLQRVTKDKEQNQEKNEGESWESKRNVRKRVVFEEFSKIRRKVSIPD